MEKGEQSTREVVAVPFSRMVAFNDRHKLVKQAFLATMPTTRRPVFGWARIGDGNPASPIYLVWGGVLLVLGIFPQQVNAAVPA